MRLVILNSTSPRGAISLYGRLALMGGICGLVISVLLAFLPNLALVASLLAIVLAGIAVAHIAAPVWMKGSSAEISVMLSKDESEEIMGLLNYYSHYRKNEAFLRETLPRREFFQVKRLRIKVAWRGIKRIYDTSAAVLRMASTAVQDGNPDVAKSADQVADLAIQVRVQCRLAFAKMSVEFLFPSVRLTPALLASKYESLQQNLSRLQALHPFAILRH